MLWISRMPAFPFLSRQALHFSIKNSKQFWALIPLRNPDWYIDNIPSSIFLFGYTLTSVIFDNTGKILTDENWSLYAYGVL